MNSFFVDFVVLGVFVLSCVLVDVDFLVLDFEKEGFYRPFPATRRNEQAAVIMQSQARKVKDEANMTLRLNISREQPVGVYKNVISFTAIAGM